MEETIKKFMAELDIDENAVWGDYYIAQILRKFAKRAKIISSNLPVMRSRPINQKTKRRILDHAKAITDYAKKL